MAIAEDRRRLTQRLTVLRVVLGVAFCLLACGFWFFQVVQHAQFKEMAENNHQRTLTLRAPRGIIYDRTGKLLVENRNSFNISIVREHTKDLDRTIRVLSQVTGLEEKAVREVVDKHRREPSYRPLVVIQDATLAQVASVSARKLDFELPDVLVQEVPTRQYPDQDMAAHTIGYVGEASEDQMQSEGVTTGSIVGQFGIERVYNKFLRGADGAKKVVVNSVGREIRTLEEIAPVQGRRVQLTVNYAMQKAAEDAFRAYGYFGSAVVLEPKTGDVLVLTSMPAFDPNDFATGIDRATWASLNTDKPAAVAPSRDAASRDRPSRSWSRQRAGRRHHARAADLPPGRRHSTDDLNATCRRPGHVDLRHAIEVVQHLLLHGRQHARRRQDTRSEKRLGAEERHRSAE
jgi:penicillin-binding protein 2